MSTLYSEHPKMFKNQPLLFILSILLIPALGLGILILLIWYLSTKASKLEVDESRIKHEKGLLSKERRALSMRGSVPVGGEILRQAILPSARWAECRFSIPSGA